MCVCVGVSVSVSVSMYTVYPQWLQGWKVNIWDSATTPQVREIVWPNIWLVFFGVHKVQFSASNKFPSSEMRTMRALPTVIWFSIQKFRKWSSLKVTRVSFTYLQLMLQFVVLNSLFNFTFICRNWRIISFHSWDFQSYNLYIRFAKIKSRKSLRWHFNLKLLPSAVV